MAGKVQSEMSTRVSLDTLSAVGSLKGLTDAVKASTNSWKANVAMLSSTGDRMGAAQAKVDGLSESIERQGAKINELKSRQEGLDVTTQSGAEQFQKLQRQIETATRQMASMESQQTRAKSSLGYYTSGLADLQRGYQTAQRASEAYVSRLQAEGREEEANKAKMSGLKQSLANLSSQYEKQESELKRIASESGATSEAYLKQKTRLDETGTAVAETRSKINELNSAMNKPASNFMTGVKEKLVGVNTEATKTSKIGSRVKDFVTGTLIAQGIQSLASRTTEWAKSGFEAAEAAQETAEKWKNMGASESSVKSLGVSVKDLKENTNLSGTAVANLTTKFFDMTGSAQKTEQLTHGVGSLSDQLKLSQTQADAFSAGLSRIESSGTVTSTSLGRLEKQAPGLGTALQRASGMSKTAFDNLVNSGKMTSSQFNDILAKASQSYKKNSGEFDSSSQGALKHIQQSWADTKQALMTPLVSVAGSGLSSLSKAMEAPAMQSAIKQLGTGIANIGTKTAGVVSYVAAHQKDINGIISSIGQIVKLLAVGAWDTFKGVVTGISNAFNTLSGNANKTKSPLTSVSSMLKSISSHQSAIKSIGAALLTAFAANKLFSGIRTLESGIAAISKATLGEAAAQKVLNASMKANIFIAVASAIAAVVAGFVELYKHNAKFRAFVNNLVKSAQQFFKGITKWFGQTWNNIKKGASNSWNNTKKAFSSGWNSAVKTTQNGYKSTVRWFSNLWSDTRKGVQNSWNDTKNKFSAGWNDTKKLTQSGANWVGNRWNQLKNDTGKIANAMKNSNNATFRNGYNTLNSYTQTWHDIMTGKWNKVGGDIRNTTNNLFKTVKSAFSGAYNWLNNLTGGRLGDILHTFSSIFGKIVGVIKGAFKGIHDGFVDIVRGIIKPFNSMLSGLKKGINWVLDKVGASKIKGDWSVTLPGYATGTKGGVLHDQLAMVNDGKGSRYREMYHTPDGEVGMFPAMRNMIVPLKAGTEILDADSSAQLAKLMGLQNYASGSIGKFFSSIFDKGKDLLEDTDKILAHPIDFLQSVFYKFVSGISSSAGIATDIITSFPSTVAKSAVNWVKKLFSDFGGGSNPSGSGVMRWKADVIKALKMNGFDATDYQVKAWLKVIQRESNGNPHAINLWDSNAKAGIPSKGLVQTIQPTFDAYAFPGHKNIWNGLDDLLAGIRYMKARYGSGTSAFARVSGPMGYANGGVVSTEGLYTLAEGNRPEFIIPTDSSKRNRAVELLNQAKTAVTGTGLSDETNARLDTLIEQNKQLINIVAALLKINPKVVLDNGALVGQLYPQIDQAGYNASAKVQRNTWG